MKLKYTKIIALLTSIGMLGTISAFAESIPIDNIEKRENQEINKADITEDNLPDYLCYDEVVSNGYTKRLYSKEQDLSQVILEKDDGTRALYIFGADVKYIDKDGKTIDKSNRVVYNGNGYKSENNNIDVTLPINLSSGINVHYDDINIQMKPIVEQTEGKISSDRSVKYNNAFGRNTSIEYTFTYDGVKEDIILDSYTGQNTFAYEVSTNGLKLIENQGCLLLVDEEGDAVSSFGDVIVFSADNKNNTFGEYSVKEIEKNYLYNVEIKVDEDYLTNPDTAYPVIIDPTLTFFTTKSNGSYVLTNRDMQVFKGTDGTGDTETSEGNSNVSRVGYTTWGACRTLMKFDGLDFSYLGINTDSQITSASIEMRDLMCQSDTTPIVCCQFCGSYWNENDNKTWNQLDAENTSTSSGIVAVSYGNGNSERTLSDSQHWYKWNIKSIVKNWITNSENKNKGVIFKTFVSDIETLSSNANFMKTFGSKESNYKPYFMMEYNDFEKDYYIVFQNDGKMLTTNSSYSLFKNSYSQTSNFQKWTVTRVADGKYVICPKNNTSKCLTAVPSSSTITLGTYSAGNTNQYWSFELTTNGDGYLKSISTGKKLYCNSANSITLSSSYYSKVVRTEVDGFIPCSSINVPNATVKIGYTKQVTYSCNPTNASLSNKKWMNFSSSNTNVFTVSSDGIITPKKAGNATLTVTHRVTGATGTANITVSRLLIYRTRNRETIGFANMDNTNDITPISPEDLQYNDLSKATITNNINNMCEEDFTNYNTRERIYEIKYFFYRYIFNDNTFTDILGDMVDHFMDGSGTVYTNVDLTESVKNHSKTTNYTNGVVNVVKSLLNDYTLSGLAYDENLWVAPTRRLNHPVVAKMNEDESNCNSMPDYGLYDGVPGLTLAIDDWYGNKIEIESFDETTSGYSGILRITFYDHFGLDTADLNNPKENTNLNPGMISAFRQWYILQHWNNLGENPSPKPFVTNVSYTVPFSGIY